MYNKDMYALGSRRSAIRELYEYGKRRAIELGAENVFDFSLGNPSVPSPECVNDTIRTLLSEGNDLALHGYTSAQGEIGVRAAIARQLSLSSGIDLTPDSIYMTSGAAAALCISLRALAQDGDEFIVLAPYFPEYKVFITAQGGKCIVVPFVEGMLPDMSALEAAITSHTKAVIINSPNNPSGVVYPREVLEQIGASLTKKSNELDREIFIISDEPYREIAYDVEVPSILSIYPNTLVCYSYSKSLSLPGERIGYIAINPRSAHADELYLAVCGAGRTLGYVCASSTYQRVIERCVDALPDVEAYRKNRDLLYLELCKIGYECIRPYGAFYLTFKALEPSSVEFCNRAKQFNLLLVACDDFGAEGYVRAAYCVDYEMIKRSISAFKCLFDSYKH